MSAEEVPIASSSRWPSVRVYRPPNTAGPSRLPPPPEDDVKPTPAELKQAFASHIEQRHGPDAPLMTKAMRDREEARLGLRKKEHSEALIRIRFSDRTQLETKLPASDQITTVYRFLRDHLDEKSQAVAFTLYQAPPKRDFPESTTDVKLKGKTLKELGMTPHASLNVRWGVAEMNADSFPAPLAPEVKEKAEELPAPPTFDGSQPATSDPQRSSTGNGTSEGETKKLPKWLKGLQSECLRLCL